MAERYYSSVAVETELTADIDSSATSMTVDDTTGLPAQFPYTLAVDIDTPSEELVEVTGAAGSTLTVTRGVDGTTGLSHEVGAAVTHVISARDLQNARDHEEAATGVHGIDSGDAVVGVTTTATLENKTIDGDDNTFQNIPQTAVTDLVSDQTQQDTRLTNAESEIATNTNEISSHSDSTNTHGVSEIVGRTESMTLRNKTINSNNNDITIGFGDVRRAILRRTAGSSGSRLDPGEEAPYGANNSTTTAITETGGSWNVSGGHSSQFTHPVTGYYMIFAQARWDAESASDVDLVRVFMYLRRNMSAGGATSGQVELSAVDTKQGVGHVNHGIQLNGIYRVTSTSSIYGLRLFNSGSSVQDIFLEPNGDGTYFQVYYLGPH